MQSSQESKINIDSQYFPHVEALARAVAILEKAGILRQDNKEEIKAFLTQDVQHADQLALALVELKSIDIYIMDDMEEIKKYLVKHAKHAHVCARMLVISGESEISPYRNYKNIRNLLDQDLLAEIEAVTETENVRHVAQLVLGKMKLKSAGPLVQEHLQPEYLAQHAEQAFGLVQALGELESKDYFANPGNIETIQRYLAKHAKPYELIQGLIVLGRTLRFHPKTDDVDHILDHMKLLDRCTQDIYLYACGMSYLFEAGIADMTYQNLLLECGDNADMVGKCFGLLKKAGQFSPGNMSLILRHADAAFAISYVMEAIVNSKKLVLDANNFNLVLKYASFGSAIGNFIMRGADQVALERFIKEIDTQVRLQKLPFLICIDKQAKVNPTKGLGLFSRFDQTLCEKIFSFLPKPKPPSNFECKR